MATNRYLSALRKWDWEGIQADALAGAADDPDNPGTKVGRCFLGTVFALAPSGKYYTPFANSNLDPCPRCEGEGHTRNPVACGWCGGSGHRSVGELAKARGEHVEATMKFLEETSTKVNEAIMSFPCFACNGTGLAQKSCSWCGGLGSREACLDQEWHEALEQVAGEHGLSIESGEGAPCDLFAVVYVEAEDGEDEEEPDGPAESAPSETREPWQIPEASRDALREHLPTES